ncbi:oligogalacturonide lyase [Arcticibacter tournemirensis]|nr:oligogalacturonate lyase family protein [Arcticibacter tournemirensis]TQM49200.1 oligogalacturonide lyase [Arcticibacter tournemirensis]
MTIQVRKTAKASVIVHNYKMAVCLMVTLVLTNVAMSQKILETGSVSPMPEEWIDKDTGHKIVRLSRLQGNNASFYFHNNPFLRPDLMAFFHSDEAGDRQIHTVDLNTLKTTALTNSPSRKGAEIVSPLTSEVFYQTKDSVFAVSAVTRKVRLVYVFPADFKANITTLNADASMLAGTYATKEQQDILKRYPEKRDFFTRIYDAHLPNTLFTINIKTGELKKIHTENTWLGHVQFSPVNPKLLMFCHEGPWHKVDRIWTIDIGSREEKLMHKRSMDMEIAGHEFFSPDGQTIWFDLQKPRGETFYLAGTDIKTGKERSFQLSRDEWSIHYNIFKNGEIFAGDGANSSQVAKAENGMWIYLFKPDGERFKSEKLVNMKKHNYALEPNVHFSPNGKWIIFRANFEGSEQIYAAAINK